MIKILGRPLWYNPPKLISFSLNGKDESKQLLDIYSFGHVQSGIIIYFLFKKLFNMSFKNAFIYTILFSILFEIFENSKTVIKQYKKTYSKYTGDSIVNIIGDICCNILGFLFAYKYPKLALTYLILAQIILSPFKAGIINTFSKLLI